jgi:pyrroloquinoline quinone biosynthesis protein B
MRTIRPTLSLLLFFLSFCGVANGQSETPYIFVLGVAQDAGYPQAGCYQPHCLPGWEDTSLRRGAASIALVDPVQGQKLLFEATPHFPEQWYALEKEAPNSEFELTGVFLTHAHIGHYVGLMFFGHEVMGASNVPVFAMPRMAEFLRTNGPWSQLVNFENISLQPLQEDTATTVASFRITPMLVPHRDEYSETVGYRIDGPSKSAIFIPDINKWELWERDIAEIVKSVDYALVDASFYSAGELPGRDASKFPHPLVTESMGLLKELSREERSKVWFIHMNHSNPLLNPDSEQHQHVLSEGFNVASEGLRLDL